jgi:hypothetical protein
MTIEEKFELTFVRYAEEPTTVQIHYQGKWVATYFDRYTDLKGKPREPWITLTKDCPEHIKKLLKTRAEQFEN